MATKKTTRGTSAKSATRKTTAVKKKAATRTATATAKKKPVARKAAASARGNKAASKQAARSVSTVRAAKKTVAKKGAVKTVKKSPAKQVVAKKLAGKVAKKKEQAAAKKVASPAKAASAPAKKASAKPAPRKAAPEKSATAGARARVTKRVAVPPSSGRAVESAAKPVARPRPTRGRPSANPVTPEQALANTRALLEAKHEREQQAPAWRALEAPHGQGVAATGFQSDEAAQKAGDLHAGESRMQAIQGSVGSQGRHRQGKRDNR